MLDVIPNFWCLEKRFWLLLDIKNERFEAAQWDGFTPVVREKFSVTLTLIRCVIIRVSKLYIPWNIMSTTEWMPLSALICHNPNLKTTITRVCKPRTGETRLFRHLHWNSFHSECHFQNKAIPSNPSSALRYNAARETKATVHVTWYHFLLVPTSFNYSTLPVFFFCAVLA